MSSALIVHCHNDDIPLWMSFSVLAHEDVTAFTMLDSYIQPSRGLMACSAARRREEDKRACAELGVDIQFAGFRDDAPDWGAVRRFLLNVRDGWSYDHVYIPAWEEGGHEHHNELSAIASRIWPSAKQALSYTSQGKSTSPNKVSIRDPRWIAKKLRALACYESQFHPATACAPHFIDRPLTEYYL